LLPKSGKYLPFVPKYLHKRLFIRLFKLNNAVLTPHITNVSEILLINGEPISKIREQRMSAVFANGSNEQIRPGFTFAMNGPSYFAGIFGVQESVILPMNFFSEKPRSRKSANRWR
jgi:hypothetical protein